MTHVLMMTLYAVITAIVMASIEPRATSLNDRVKHGLKIFGSFMGVGLALSWILFPIPW